MQASHRREAAKQCEFRNLHRFQPPAVALVGGRGARVPATGTWTAVNKVAICEEEDVVAALAVADSKGDDAGAGTGGMAVTEALRGAVARAGGTCGGTGAVRTTACWGLEW